MDFLLDFCVVVVDRQSNVVMIERSEKGKEMRAMIYANYIRSFKFSSQHVFFQRSCVSSYLKSFFTYLLSLPKLISHHQTL